MTLLQLQYFREVARTKHFTAAAENLHVAQPSLSYSIKELENSLGVPLFSRSASKKIDLTVYGSVFLKYVEQALDALDEGCAAIYRCKSQQPNAPGGGQGGQDLASGMPSDLLQSICSQREVV